jgi:hypothetical protein
VPLETIPLGIYLCVEGLVTQLALRTFFVALLMSAVVTLGAAGFAADRTDYSGTYAVMFSKGAKAEPATILHVVQNNETIQINREVAGKTTTSRFPLNGSEGDYTSPGGISGRGKAQFKGKNLVVESVVVTKPQPNGPPVRLRTRERWQLSPDAKVLTIRFNVDFPDFEQFSHGATDQSWSETYLRSDQQ